MFVHACACVCLHACARVCVCDAGAYPRFFKGGLVMTTNS